MYGYFEFMVIKFGLANALAAFMNIMNKVFRPFLDMYIVAFIEYINTTMEINQVPPEKR